jgi:hypothetical protein
MKSGRVKMTGTEIPKTLIILSLPSLLLAKREHPEKWYQQKWCEAHEGRVEVVMPDGTCIRRSQPSFQYFLHFLISKQ